MPRQRRRKAAPTPKLTPDGRRPTEALSDAQRAHIWVLREEDLSLRDIAGEIGCSAQTVARELQTDPTRLEALVTAHREQRTKLWTELESITVRGALKLAKWVDGHLFTNEGRLRRGIKPREVMQLAPRLLSAFRLAGDSSTQRTMTLGMRLPGGAVVAAQVATGGLPEGDEMNADTMIDQAIAYGPECVNLLPDRLRMYAQRRMEKAP